MQHALVLRAEQAGLMSELIGDGGTGAAEE
jgi:hypothetical protein